MPRYSQNQLFIGRLPRSCRDRDLEDIFDRYGKLLRCDMKTGAKLSYGFIEYEDPRDAEDAIDGENGRDMNGSNIVVEWARGPKYDYRRDESRHDKGRRYSPPRRDYRRRSRSRSCDRRSRSRDRRSRSRDRRSRSHDRPSKSYDRRSRSHDRRSRSHDRPSRSYDRRSRSHDRRSSSDDRRSRSRD